MTEPSLASSASELMVVLPEEALEVHQETHMWGSKGGLCAVILAVRKQLEQASACIPSTLNLASLYVDGGWAGGLGICHISKESHLQGVKP